jgi:membrane protein
MGTVTGVRWRRRRRQALARWRWTRARFGWLDHLVRAVVRYGQADGRRLAAAVTLYAFFAAFALGLLGFAVLGFVLDEPAVARAVQRFLDEHLPQMDTQALRDARGAAGLIAMVSLPIIGMLWVDSLRSSVRAVWRVEEYPGRWLTRWLLDLLALIVLGFVLAVSLTVAFGTEALLGRLLAAAGGDEFAPAQWLLATIRFLLGLAVNLLLSISVLTLLPRLRVPPRRVLVPALVIAVGLEVLTSMGRIVVVRAEANPAFQVVAGAAGLLVFLLVLNQLILFAAALTATGTGGPVRDLATGELLAADPPSDTSAAPAPPQARPAEPPQARPAEPPQARPAEPPATGIPSGRMET